MILPVVLFAQAGFAFNDKKGDLSGRAGDGTVKLLPSGYEVQFKRGVAFGSKTRRFNLTSDQVTARLRTAQGSGPSADLEWAKATGRVQITQITGSKSSSLSSNSATYTVRGKGGEVTATGSVRIQNLDSQKRQTILATGSSGTATLSPDSKRGIDRATLNGPVRVEIVEAGNRASRVVATGSKMTLNGNTLTLSGRIVVDGTGQSQLGNFSGTGSLVAQLTDDGEWRSATFKSGGG